MEPRGIGVLGSTGSIGEQTLEIIRLFPDRFSVKLLTAHTNADRLVEQALEFTPACVVIGRDDRFQYVADALKKKNILVLAGRTGLCDAVHHEGISVLVAAVVGFAGLEPVIRALQTGITVALANKEAMVVAGPIMAEHIRRTGARLIPVDSEHSAIFQCLLGEPSDAVEELILTASGGPFRERRADTFASITVEEALSHPNWSMGSKITIDSATMMNKGLEVIEARWLFDVEAERISVLVHPQSIVHSMVVFRDGAVKAQLGVPDMKVPIQYALSYPDRWPAPHDRLDWTKIRALDFEQPDASRFPCLGLAYEALRRGGVAPAVLNAANEAAVDLFLREKIQFPEIPTIIEKTLSIAHSNLEVSLDSLTNADAEARRYAKEHAKARVH